MVQGFRAWSVAVGLVFTVLILAALVAVSLDLRYLSHLAYPIFAGSWYWAIQLCYWAIGLCCVVSAGGLVWLVAEKVRFDSRVEGRPWSQHLLVRTPVFLVAVFLGPYLLVLLAHFVLTRLGMPCSDPVALSICIGGLTFLYSCGSGLRLKSSKACQSPGVRRCRRWSILRVGRRAHLAAGGYGAWRLLLLRV